MEALYEPQSLQEAIVYFSEPMNCLKYLALRRPEWKDGVVCPTCGSASVSFLKNQVRWQCNARHPKRQFSVKVGTIFEDSPLGLDKWLPAMWLILNCKNGVSSCEIARALKVTQKTAWFMLHRIRLAMQDNLTGGMLGGEVEVDETFIGGKVRNMHKARKREVQKHSQKGDKTIVLGVLERASEGKPKRVRATVIADRKKPTIQAEVSGIVEQGTKVYSDEYGNQWRMDEQFEHSVVDHLTTYVDGQVHTQGLENFWSLLKRGLGGTYISVEPFHLFRYVDEQAWRFNNRKMTDGERFDWGVREIVGKRLTYSELIGKEEQTGTEEVEPF
jgi:transposase-like protein